MFELKMVKNDIVVSADYEFHIPLFSNNVNTLTMVYNIKTTNQKLVDIIQNHIANNGAGAAQYFLTNDFKKDIVSLSLDEKDVINCYMINNQEERFLFINDEVDLKSIYDLNQLITNVIDCVDFFDYIQKIFHAVQHGKNNQFVSYEPIFDGILIRNYSGEILNQSIVMNYNIGYNLCQDMVDNAVDKAKAIQKMINVCEENKYLINCIKESGLDDSDYDLIAKEIKKYVPIKEHFADIEFLEIEDNDSEQYGFNEKTMSFKVVLKPNMIKELELKMPIDIWDKYIFQNKLLLQPFHNCLTDFVQSIVDKKVNDILLVE